MDDYKEKERNLINNMKGILMILVVAGHLLEKTHQANLLFLSKFIYSFHMTTFIFISGYLAKNIKTNYKNLINISLLYLSFNTIFQIIFCKQLSLVPFWTLWYLEALVFYRVILIFVNKLKESKKVKNSLFNLIMSIFIIITILISLFGIINFGTHEIPDFKIIKISMYLPIFFMGYLFSKENLKRLKEFICNTKVGNIAIVLLTIFMVFLNFKFVKNMPLHFIYVNGGFAEWYVTFNEVAFSRFILYITGIGLSIVLLRIVSDKKIKFITNMGENSLCIFILHTLVLQIARELIKSKIINIPMEYEAYYVVFMTIFVLIVTSNKYVTGVFNKYSNFIKKISEKMTCREKKDIK